jgi:two-component system response regulator MprA
MDRLLLVEDDNGLRDVFARGLREQGFDVITASDGTSALRTAAVHRFDAVLMDIGLPDSDGRDVCRAMRAAGLDIPVLFLTARGQLADRLSGFASGGDDYLAKPVAFPELVARLRAMLRRASAPRAAGPTELKVDPSTHSLLGLDLRVALTPIEFRLLARLLTTPAAVVRRRELVEAAWPAGAMVSDNTLDQYVSKLRRKLVDVGSDRGIESVRGVGYRVA